MFPNDKMIWSCLVNAALEVGDAESARSTLQQYQKAELDINGHVLLFRTFMVLKDADAAETVFHELGAEASPLMLNLLLLTCGNNKEPSAAWGSWRKPTSWRTRLAISGASLERLSQWSKLSLQHGDEGLRTGRRIG